MSDSSDKSSRDDDPNDDSSTSSESSDSEPEVEEDGLSREFESLGLQDDLPLPIVPLGERATIHDYRKVRRFLVKIRKLWLNELNLSIVESYKSRFESYADALKLKSSRLRSFKVRSLQVREVKVSFLPPSTNTRRTSRPCVERVHLPSTLGQKSAGSNVNEGLRLTGKIRRPDIRHQGRGAEPFQPSCGIT